MATKKKVAKKATKRATKKPATKKVTKRKYTRRVKPVEPEVVEQVSAEMSPMGPDEDAKKPAREVSFLEADFLDFNGHPLMARVAVLSIMEQMGYKFHDFTDGGVLVAPTELNSIKSVSENQYLHMNHQNRVIYGASLALAKQSGRVASVNRVDFGSDVAIGEPGPILPDSLVHNGSLYVRIA